MFGLTVSEVPVRGLLTPLIGPVLRQSIVGEEARPSRAVHLLAAAKQRERERE